MKYVNSEALVSTEWLVDHLNTPELRIIDASSVLPNVNRDPNAEFLERHIPGAQFFNINEIANTDHELPHMLPSAEKFSSEMRKMGIGDGVKVIAYDSNGGFSAACRAWWMFRVFGHENVSVLNGGLPKWLADGLPVENGILSPHERHFTMRKSNSLVRNVEQVLANIETCHGQVIDARSPGRFLGVDPEPRPSRKKGHIPRSLNLPYNLLMDVENNYVFLVLFY